MEKITFKHKLTGRLYVTDNAFCVEQYRKNDELVEQKPVVKKEPVKSKE